MKRTSQREQAEAFRRLHREGGILVLPNAWDVITARVIESAGFAAIATSSAGVAWALDVAMAANPALSRSEEHTSELQSRLHLVCRLLLEKKKKNDQIDTVLNQEFRSTVEIAFKIQADEQELHNVSGE